MKKFLVLTICAALFFAVSCGGSGESKKVVEEKSQTITASEGGEIEVAGGEAKIKIPAGALDKDTEISVTLYTTDGFKNKKALASNVVEFGPSGTKFKKPVVITINAGKAVKGKTVAAAVMKGDGTWSYSEKGAYALFGGYDEAGDPIMTTAAGDPIMISNGNVTTAAGDPIMNAAAGDPIMLASAGDPIMTNAAGDPIMNAAAGDPIMMTTGHFSDYTFIVVDEVEEENSSNNGGGSSGKVTCKTAREWDKLDGTADDEYEKDDESIYCQKTGEEIVYCIEGAFTGENTKIYSVKVDGKEFKCKTDNNYDCIMEMEQYCEALDGEYEDGFYCEEEGVCEKTGETSKVCASTKGDGNFYYQVGDRKFECNEENMQSCYEEYYEYCGSTDSEIEDGYYCEEMGECKETGETVKSCTSIEDYEGVYYQVGETKFECTRENLEECYTEVYEYCGAIDEISDPGEKIDENVPEECEYYMFCDGGGFVIYRCTPEDGDIYLYISDINGYSQMCSDPEPDKERCDSELENFAESCNN